jgi:Ni/Co efflux regulator RcnB
MKTVLAALAAAALIAAPLAGHAQSGKTPDEKGSSQSAPGQMAKQKGEAKDYAPGQMRKDKDDPKSPGASEYAPGQQSNPGQPSKQK